MDKTLLDANYKIATEYGRSKLADVCPPDLRRRRLCLIRFHRHDRNGRRFLHLPRYLQGRAQEYRYHEKQDQNDERRPKKAKAIDKFVEAIDPSRREKYSEMIRQVPGLATGDAADLKGKYQLQVAYLDAITLYKDSKMVEGRRHLPQTRRKRNA